MEAEEPKAARRSAALGVRVRGCVQRDSLGVGGVPVDGLQDERAAQVQFEGDKQNSNRISPQRLPHGASRLPSLLTSQNMSRRIRRVDFFFFFSD